jgi:glucans biosynthesis protein C
MRLWPIGGAARGRCVPTVGAMTHSPVPSLTEQSPPPAASLRLHHLDALRGGALLLGVLLHALMPFLPGDPWLVNDTADSWAAGAAIGVIHLFRMMLFMMLAGFFGRMVLHRRGAGAYLRDRLLRVGLPLPLLAPPLFALMVLALVLNELFGAVPTPAPPEGSAVLTGPLSLPTMHLWFLLLLLEVALVTVAVRAVLLRLLGPARAGRLGRGLGTALSSPWGLPVLAVPYAVGLLVQEGGVTSLTEPYTLMPVAGAGIGYAGAFLAGWFLHARRGALTRIEGRWITHLGLALVLSPLALLSPAFAPAPVGAALTALAGWAWVLGLTGLCARLVRREIPWVRYLADSSYWVYLMHFPLLLLMAVALSGLAVPAAVKLVIAVATVTAVLLLSYDLCVRSTWVGAWLNGRRRPRALVRRVRRGGQPFTPPAAAKP